MSFHGVALKPDSDFEVYVPVATDRVARGEAIAHLQNVLVERRGGVMGEKMQTRSSSKAPSFSSLLWSWSFFFFASGMGVKPKTCSTTTVLK